MYCSRCGSTIAETVVVCPVCGQSQVAGYTPVAPPLVQPTGPAEVTPHWQPSGVAYAGFWLRVVAHILDGLIIGLPFTIIVIIVVLSSGIGTFLHNIPNVPNPPDPDEVASAFGAAFFVGLGLMFVVAFFGSWLYYALFESSSWQSTPGKKVLNIFVTDINGAPVTFGRASGRYFAKFITQLIPLGIGYMLAGLTERKQALHDMIASTLVLRR